jgi:hypothetical protein
LGSGRNANKLICGEDARSITCHSFCLSKLRGVSMPWCPLRCATALPKSFCTGSTAKHEAKPRMMMASALQPLPSAQCSCKLQMLGASTQSGTLSFPPAVALSGHHPCFYHSARIRWEALYSWFQIHDLNCHPTVCIRHQISSHDYLLRIK